MAAGEHSLEESVAPHLRRSILRCLIEAATGLRTAVPRRTKVIVAGWERNAHVDLRVAGHIHGRWWPGQMGGPKGFQGLTAQRRIVARRVEMRGVDCTSKTFASRQVGTMGTALGARVLRPKKYKIREQN